MLQKNTLLFSSLFLCLLLLAWWHLVVGISNPISIGEHFSAVFNFDDQNFDHILSREFRMPRLVIAIVAGAALSISGMLTQTLFRNPLTDPFVLGINAGAGLFVATGILSGFAFIQSNTGILTLALMGALVFGFLILTLSTFLKNNTSLLIIGIMIGSFAGAFTSIVQYLSTPESIKSFMIWGLGSLQQVSFTQIGIITIVFTILVVATFFLVKPLNALVLGNNQAQLLGINVKRSRFFVLLLASSLAGLVTAFCGPIAFVGMAIPNICKLLFRTQNHLTLIIANLLLGPIFLLLCDIFIQLLQENVHIPINAFTSILGAPFIIFIILKRWS